jgi:hypothetical protein
MYIGGTQNTVANWLESDATSAGQLQFGLSTGTAYFNNTGMYYRTILGQATGSTPAAIAPSANAAFKIVDAVSIPPNTLDLIGRILRFTVFCNITNASNEAQQIQVVANPTNTGFTAASYASWLPGANNATNSGIASKTDGSVTLTGGTAILDSTGITYNAGALSGFVLVGEFICTGVSTQESVVRGITTGATGAGVGPVTDRTITSTAGIVFAIVVKTATTNTNLVYCGAEVEVLN